MAADDGPVDVLRCETDDGPVYRAIDAGDGSAVVDAHERRVRNRNQTRLVAGGVVALGRLGCGLLSESVLLGALAAVTVGTAFWYGGDDRARSVSTVVERSQFRRGAQREYDFEES